MICPYCEKEMTWSSAGYEFCVWDVDGRKYPIKNRHDKLYGSIPKLTTNKQKTIKQLEELIKRNDDMLKLYGEDVKLLNLVNNRLRLNLKDLSL